MKNWSGQMTLILLLMLALFLQIEGVMPNIFAGNDAPLTMTSQKDGLEFKIAIESKGFSEKDSLVIKATINNMSASPIHYYSGTASYGFRGALGVALYSANGKSKFTDLFEMETAGISLNAAVFEGELKPGNAMSSEFTLMPYFIDKGIKKAADPGSYILKLKYNRDIDGTITAEFPLTIVKRFGRMYVKSQA